MHWKLRPAALLGCPDTWLQIQIGPVSIWSSKIPAKSSAFASGNAIHLAPLVCLVECGSLDPVTSKLLISGNFAARI